ncbi:MAG TPA: MarR family transcriptional regulator [Hyphomicrobiaceae bacterium]|nr:MarR family transcriptional regulator [Hyphomicrobiaceae bacterium]
MDRLMTLHIGIAPASYVKKRMIEIARGGKPLRGEPRVWVSSLDSLAKVLTEKNMLLLEMIRSSQPQSLGELARLSDRKLPNLSRTLHTMERLGIVALQEKPNGRKVPTVLCTKVQFVLNFASPGSEAA